MLRFGRRPGVASSTSRLLPYSGLVMVLVLVLLGFADLNGAMHYLLTVSAAWGIAAIGLDLSTGLAGQALFGQTAFVAISAYAFIVSWDRWHPPLLVAALFAVAFTAVVAAVIGSAMVRLKHLGAVLVTFFFAFVVAQLATGTWLQDLTGGVNGLPAPPTSLNADDLYFVSMALLAVVLLVAWNYRTSRSGWALQLVKRNEVVAETVGINPAGRKLAVFVFAAVLSGVTGVLLTLSIGFIAPDTFDPIQSIILFAMIALGGIGSVSGGILGAVVLTCLPHYLHGAQRQSDVIYALVLLFFLVVWPDGVVGSLNKAAAWIRRRAFGAAEDDQAQDAPRTASVVDPDTVEAAVHAEGVDQRGRGLNLVVGNLDLQFGGVKALDGLSLAVANSAIHAIIGPNGAGKTSLLNCISGVEHRWSGNITVGETDVLPKSSARKVAALGVSRTFQNASLVLEMSAIHNVALGLYKARTWSSLRDLVGPLANGRLDRRIRTEVDEALDLVGIAASRRRLPVRDLSLAETKLIDVARAIVAKPRLLLLDEPTAGLSGDEIELCASFISELNASQHTTVVLVSHHVGFIRRIASRATVLDYGRVIGDDEPNALLGEDVVIEAFLGSAK